jgi:hypothetical protein
LTNPRATTARRQTGRAKTAAPRRRPELLAGEDLPAIAKQKRSLGKRAALLKSALRLFGKRGSAVSINTFVPSAKSCWS